jgi:hypothetical protein
VRRCVSSLLHGSLNLVGGLLHLLEESHDAMLFWYEYEEVIRSTSKMCVSWLLLTRIVLNYTNEEAATRLRLPWRRLLT